MPLIKDATGPGAVERLCALAEELAVEFEQFPSHAINVGMGRDESLPVIWQGGMARELRSCVKMIRKGGR